MIRSWTVTAAGLVCLVIVPFVFEFYTFHLYDVRDPSFFTFSGARLWAFLVIEIVFGLVIGYCARIRPIIVAGLVAAATTILIGLLYHICDSRQCYYSGPDGFAEARLWTLFFAAATVGTMIGHVNSQPMTKWNTPEVLLFGTVTAIFLGYHLWSLLFATYMPSSLAIAALAWSTLVPFMIAGIVTRLSSDRLRYPLYSALAGWSVLAILFASLRPSSGLLLPMLLAGAVCASVAGFALVGQTVSRVRKNSLVIVFAPLLALFALGASHPFIDSPMNLTLHPDSELLPAPTYYSGTYHESDHYFSTKRVEVQIDLAQFNAASVTDLLVAGMGVQSPNCCKDGLDYGYRADFMFNGSGTFLVARAWETCDMNIACGGFPWISTMHQTAAPLRQAAESVALAMEWQQVEKAVAWYYRADSSDWMEYSHVVPPDIENAYFNLGVIGVGNPISNPDTGNAFFFQAGVSTSGPDSASLGSLTFDCLAYYDEMGERHCAELEAVAGGNSHWKVLWKWGIQGDVRIITTERSKMTVDLG